MVIVERQPPTQHDVEDDTTAPNIDLWSRVQSKSSAQSPAIASVDALAADNLWSSIVGAPTRRLEEITVRHDI